MRPSPRQCQHLAHCPDVPLGANYTVSRRHYILDVFYSFQLTLSCLYKEDTFRRIQVNPLLSGSLASKWHLSFQHTRRQHCSCHKHTIVCRYNSFLQLSDLGNGQPTQLIYAHDSPFIRPPPILQHLGTSVIFYSSSLILPICFCVELCIISTKLVFITHPTCHPKLQKM